MSNLLNTNKKIATRQAVLARYSQKYPIRKAIVLGHYSNGTFRCACCHAYDGLEFLTIDHIVPCLGKREHNLYLSLINRRFPKGYQVLCYNCNMAKHAKRACPHADESPIQFDKGVAHLSNKSLQLMQGFNLTTHL